MTISLLSSTSFGSHYYLTDVDSFEKEKIILLTKNKIQTTEHFLQASITAEQRRELAQYLNVSEQELTDFALSCELMQIQGIGPRAVRLLKSTGIKNIEQLSKSDVNKLFHDIIDTNKKEKITDKQPTIDLVQYWIDQSKKVPFKIEL